MSFVAFVFSLGIPRAGRAKVHVTAISRNGVKAGSSEDDLDRIFEPFLPWAIAVEKLTMPLHGGQRPRSGRHKRDTVRVTCSIPRPVYEELVLLLGLTPKPRVARPLVELTVH